MTHFLSSHCRRMEELWMGVRMVCLFSPVCYPPRQNYCICLLAILEGKHMTTSHRPRYIRNLGLPTRELYFAELVAVMFTKIDKSEVLCEGIERDQLDESETPRAAQDLPRSIVELKPREDNDMKSTIESITPRDGPMVLHQPPVDHNQLYIFWLMSHDKLPRDVKVRLYIYALEHGVCGGNRNLIQPIRMSEFINVPNMLRHHEDTCLILYHPTMAEISNSFKDIIYVDARPVYGERYSAHESADEMWSLQP
ncbi:uncharacterized protein DMAD_08631 [Drosophila madeirensis]|uniref:DUF4729 domain-containing protein n=1 Tax=Drosophila madeirensis TaxID=30013 RepID=A0AAU9EU15_DROMD